MTRWYIFYALFAHRQLRQKSIDFEEIIVRKWRGSEKWSNVPALETPQGKPTTRTVFYSIPLPSKKNTTKLLSILNGMLCGGIASSIQSHCIPFKMDSNIPLPFTLVRHDDAKKNTSADVPGEACSSIKSENHVQSVRKQMQLRWACNCNIKSFCYKKNIY